MRANQYHTVTIRQLRRKLAAATVLLAITSALLGYVSIQLQREKNALRTCDQFANSLVQSRQAKGE